MTLVTLARSRVAGGWFPAAVWGGGSCGARSRWSEKSMESDRLVLYRQNLVDENYSGRQIGHLSIAESRLVRCDFSKSKIKAGSFGGGRRASVYRDCVFDGMRLNGVHGGYAVFESCSFRNVRITNGWFQNCEFVDCVFTGTLRGVLFFGAPLSDSVPDLGRTKNRFYGNDFSQARLINVSFRFGVDLSTQRLPKEDEYLYLVDADSVLRKIRKKIRGWSQEVQQELDSTLSVYELEASTGQRDLFIHESLVLGGEFPEARRRLWELLRSMAVPH